MPESNASPPPPGAVASYRGAVQDLRMQHLGTAGSAPNSGEGDSVRARCQALMHQLLEGGPTRAAATEVDRCVFQSVAIDRTMDFASRLPADPDDEAVSGDRCSRTEAGGRGTRTVRRVQKPFEISIPLASDRVKLAEVKKSLKSEYAARYCEALGVAPTHRNIALINRHMPLDQCKLTQVFQPGLGRGERRNHVAIQPGFHSGHAARARASQPRSSVLPFEMLPRQERPSPPSTRHVADAPLDPPGRPRQPRFEAYKARFIFPFNLTERFEGTVDEDDAFDVEEGGKRPATPQGAGKGDEKAVARAGPPVVGDSVFSGTRLPAAKQLQVHDALLAKLDAAAEPDLHDQAHLTRSGGAVTRDQLRELEELLEGRLPAPAPFDFGKEDGAEPRGSPGVTPSDAAAPAAGAARLRRFVGREHMDLLIHRELEMAPLSFEASEIRAVAQQVAGDFPFSKLGTPTAAAEAAQRATTFLTSPAAVAVAEKLLCFLVAAYVAPLTPNGDAATTPLRRDDLFVTLYGDLVDLLRRGVGHAHIPLHVPLLILTLRVVVETELTAHLPHFCACPLGRRVLRRMDAFTMAIADPMGLLSRIPALESAPQALRVLHAKRLPPRFTPLATTPMTQFILGDSIVSTRAKTLARPHPLVREGVEELQTHLTPLVRTRLLRIVIEKKIQP